MSFIPTHEIGLLNAWIFAITLAIFAFLPMILHKKAWKRLIDSSWCGSKEKELGGILGFKLWDYCVCDLCPLADGNHLVLCRIGNICPVNYFDDGSLF